MHLLIVNLTLEQIVMFTELAGLVKIESRSDDYFIVDRDGDFTDQVTVTKLDQDFGTE